MGKGASVLRWKSKGISVRLQLYDMKIQAARTVFRKYALAFKQLNMSWFWRSTNGSILARYNCVGGIREELKNVPQIACMSNEDDGLNHNRAQRSTEN